MFTTGFGPGWGDRAGLPPATAAEQLPAFEDCAELRGWYVDAALALVGRWASGAAEIPVDRGVRVIDVG